jgi:hypothetical protein
VSAGASLVERARKILFDHRSIILTSTRRVAASPAGEGTLAFPIALRHAYNKRMLKKYSRRLLVLSALVSALLFSFTSHAQKDTEQRGRKYVPPPATAHVAVAVVKDANGKPIENAAVIFHMIGERDKGNMELKTNELGKAIIDVIPIGDTVRLQVIASGFQTYGEDYKIETDAKDITVRMKRPARQYSTYEHPETGGKAPSPSANSQSAPQNPPPAPPQ